MMFSEKNGQAIENYINKNLYKLVPLTHLEPTESQLERVASICNEPLVFETLFSKVFPEGEYPLSSAADWIQWGKTGWEEESHFVFATIEDSGLVVAACDIKSANKDSAEIGFWASALHRGVMSNSVAIMLQLAKESGFQGFFAEVHKDNTKSQRVLKRNDFSPSAEAASASQHIIFRY